MNRRLLRSLFFIPLVLLACNAAPQQGDPRKEILTGPPKSAELVLRQPDEGFRTLACKTDGDVDLLWELYKLPSGKFIHYFTTANKTTVEIEVRWPMLDRKRMRGEVHLVTFRTKENQAGNGEISTNEDERDSGNVITLRPGEEKTFLSWTDGIPENRINAFHKSSCEKAVE